MLIDFGKIENTAIKEFKGGKNITNIRMFVDSNNKIMLGKLEPDSSIGLHTHQTNSEIIYILSGKGRVLFDGEYEELTVGSCHYCPMGHSHSLINNSDSDLVFFAVVPEHNIK